MTLRGLGDERASAGWWIGPRRFLRNRRTCRSPSVSSGDGLNDGFAEHRLRQIGRKARFTTPLDVLLLPIAAQRNAGKADSPYRTSHAVYAREPSGVLEARPSMSSRPICLNGRSAFDRGGPNAEVAGRYLQERHVLFV